MKYHMRKSPKQASNVINIFRSHLNDHNGGFKHAQEGNTFVPSPIYPSDNIRLIAEDRSTLGKIKGWASCSRVKSTDSVSG